MPYGGLQKQTIPVLLRGLDQKNPKQAAVTGELDLLQNMIAVKGTGNATYELMPRPGVTALSKTTDGSAITSGKKLAALGPQLLLNTGNVLFRKAADEWHTVDTCAPIFGVQTSPAISDALLTASADSVYVNGYTVTVSAVSTVGSQKLLMVTVTDSTGAVVLSGVRNSATNIIAPRVVASGTAVIILWQQNPLNLFASKLDTSTMTFSVTQTVSATAALGISAHDAQTLSNTGVVVISYLSSATSTWHLRLLTVSSMALGTDVNTTIAGVPCFSFMANDWSTSDIYAVWGGSGTASTVTTFNSSTLATLTTNAYGSNTAWYNLTGTRVGSTLTIVGTTTADGTSGTAGNPVYDRRIGMTFVVGGSPSFNGIRGIYLASKAISANGTTYAMARYLGTGQGTLFLIDIGAAKMVGKALPGVCAVGADPINGILPGLAAGPDANTWITAAIKNTADVSSGGALTAYTGSVSIAWKLGDVNVDRGCELLGWHFPGALPMLYDGGTLTEDGFPIAPEQSDTIVTAPSGSMVAGATYSVRACYAWLDSAGNVHRSQPTIVAQQFPLGGSDGRATFAIPTLRFTRKTNVSVEIYLTPSNGDGSAYFMVTDPTNPLMNDPTVDRVIFTCTASDLQIEAGLPLYTQGGVLDNISPPPCRTMVVHRGRILIGGVDNDAQAVWFSKNVGPGFGVAFSDGLVSRLNSTSEMVTAIGTMDAYAVACTPGTTWASGDQYPDDTGTGGVLDFQEYSGSTGSGITSALARTDQGSMVWAGAKGPWRLSRGLSWDYAGSPIEDDAATFTALTILQVPLQNQVRIVGTRGGVSTVFTFETIFGTWGRWVYATVSALFVDAFIWAGSVAYLCADGTVVVEDTTKYDDLGAPASVVHQVEISAVNLAGVGGYKRVYGAQAIGRVLGTGGFTLVLTQTIDSLVKAAKTRAISPSAVDLDTEVDPGPDGKCTDYSLLVSDSGNGANTAFSLSAITMQVGLKEGMDKLPAANRAT